MKARKIICGTPRILIKDGKIVEEALKKEMYTINDLLEQLRNQNFISISDVEVAILETNGQLSVFPIAEKRNTHPQDFNINANKETLPINLIIDGTVNEYELQKGTFDMNWLNLQLKNANISSVQEVLYACKNTDGTLFIQQKGL